MSICQCCGCRFWIRDDDDVAAFRCGDKSNKGIELCHECKEKYRKESIIMNGKRCALSNSNHVFHCHCNDCNDNIKGYLGKEVGKTYLYTGKFAPIFLQGKKVAEYGLKYKSISSKDVKHLGLKSTISNQILKKYSKSKTVKNIKSVKLTVPNQSIKIRDNKIYIPCLKLHLDIYFKKSFIKINQIEIGKEFAHISVSYPDKPIIKSTHTIGIDRNTTHHTIVGSCLETGKVIKLGKSCNHIHHKYKNIRKSLQKQGKLRRINTIKNRESRIVRDINHKTSKAVVLFARENNACLVMEDLVNCRKTMKNKKRQRYSLHSWSFYQQKQMIEYKAKKYGVSVYYVAPQYTSQRCSICGHIERANRKGNLFHCKRCGTVEDSGVNAGFNIAYLHRKGIPQFNIERDMLKGNTDIPKEATS